LQRIRRARTAIWSSKLPTEINNDVTTRLRDIDNDACVGTNIPAKRASGDQERHKRETDGAHPMGETKFAEHEKILGHQKRVINRLSARIN
jgi:hypothetical protein